MWGNCNPLLKGVGMSMLYCIQTAIKMCAESGLRRSSCDLSLQNGIIRNLRFCSFSGRLNSHKALTVTARHVSNRRFLPRHDAVRPLRLFRNANFHHFQAPVFVPKSCRFSTVRPSRGRNGAVVAMRRRPRCDAVRPSLQPRKALTASPSLLSGKTIE